jgi:hypothetical protein
MKYLTLFLFLLIAFSAYSQDADSLQAEKILAEARLLGEGRNTISCSIFACV